VTTGSSRRGRSHGYGFSVTAPRIRRPRVLLVGIVLLAAAVALGIWSSVVPKGTPIGWQLANLHSVGGPRGWDSMDEAKAATVVYLTTSWWPYCHPYDDNTGPFADSSWLTPDITYSPGSVTITMRIKDAYYQNRECGRGFYDYWGLPVAVPLREPLGGRFLFDGSTSPPAARPYP
jgi:hypothetical protein